MRAQVLAFLRPVKKTSDWTQEELAELYRIQNALVQARLMVDVDRGLSDEGDPWFVFCRPDGEVLVNISRIDGDYYLHSPALPEQMRGHSFQDLVKAFVDRIPMQVPVQRKGSAQLYVHPAAMLTLLIGTIFFAWDDTSLAFGKKPADDLGGNETVDKGGFKAALQSAFHTYLDSIFGVRDGGPVQHSAFLTLVSTVAAAFALGVADLFHDTVRDAGLVAQILADDQGSPAAPENSALTDDDSVQAASLAGKLTVSASGAHAGQESPVQHTELAQQHDQETTAPASLPEIVTRADDGIHKNLEIANSMPGDFGGGDRFKAEDHDAPIEAKSIVQLVRGSSESLVEGNGASADAVKSSSLAVGPQGEHLAIDQFFQNLKIASPSLVVTVTDQNALTFFVTEHPVNLGPVTTGESLALSGPITASSFLAMLSKDLPVFDEHAAVVINHFLAAAGGDDHVEVTRDDRNYVFYDGHSELDSHGVIWQAWETESGAIVAIVGHADTMHAAALA